MIRVSACLVCVKNNEVGYSMGWPGGKEAEDYMLTLPEQTSNGAACSPAK